jgi:RES domain-containing protein
MLVVRIANQLYSRHLTASGVSGRWNSHGKMVIYTTESVAIALLENMVRRQGVGFSNLFETTVIEVPDDIAISTISAAEMNAIDRGWRNPMTGQKICQPLGDEWYERGEAAVLKVPSAVVDGNNYVINITHRDFARINLIGITPFEPDQRIEDILKNYKP